MERRRVIFAGAASMATLLAACGGGDTSGSGSGTPAPGIKGQAIADMQSQVEAITGKIASQSGSTTRGISGNSITVAGVGTLTVGGVVPFPGLCEGAKARFDRANKEGGINGKTINYLGCKDDGGDPSKSLQALQDQTQGGNAFAIVPYVSVGGGAAAADFLNKNKVPYFGAGYFPTDFGYNYPYSFPLLGGGASNPVPAKGKFVLSTDGIDAYAAATSKKPGDIKVAIVGQDSPAGNQGTQFTAQGSKAAGYQVAYAKNPLPTDTSPPLTDYTPIANDILDSGANLVYLATGPGPVVGLTSALKSAGYQGDIEQFGYTDVRALADANTRKTLDGTFGASLTGWPQTNAGAFQQMRKDLDASGATNVAISAGVILGYGAADSFLAGLAKTPSTLTAESLANIINADGYQYAGLDGVTCPTYWPAFHVLGVPCIGLAKTSASANGGKGDFVPVGKLQSYPEQLVNA